MKMGTNSILTVARDLAEFGNLTGGRHRRLLLTFASLLGFLHISEAASTGSVASQAQNPFGPLSEKTSSHRKMACKTLCINEL
jgi:hypothetical protein